MTTKTPIRVIKRGYGEDQNAEVVLKSDDTTIASARSAARAAVSIWVRELQQQRRTDPRRAFKNLFEEQCGT